MGASRRLRWMRSSLGAKPTAPVSLGMLLDTSDLPGLGWRQRDERTWRTGEALKDALWAQRAREIGSVTAWRSFEQGEDSTWLWCEVVPLASPQDAESALDDLPGLVLRNLRVEVTVVAGRDYAAPEIASVNRAWAHEQETTGRRGPGFACYFAAAVGPVIVALCASDLVGPAWDLVASLATRQVQRVTNSTER